MLNLQVSTAEAVESARELALKEGLLVSSAVKGVKGPLGLSPLGFISCLLRGKVKPLYIKRGDASI